MPHRTCWSPTKQLSASALVAAEDGKWPEHCLTPSATGRKAKKGKSKASAQNKGESSKSCGGAGLEEAQRGATTSTRLLEDDTPEHTHTRAGCSPACGPASASTLGSKSRRSPLHTVPAQILPTASHPLGPAVPRKLLKHQSRVASPPPQGSENGQLFLSTQPQWDHPAPVGSPV